jgi:ubiquinone/menaquinone biosynthesis C-methylase UbiE
MDAQRDQALTPSTTGVVVHGAARYDLLVWLVTLGRERVFREKVLHLARLEPGESVLDVGCGTGTLAITAKRHVGPPGTVHGMDASPQMIARAGKKARKAGVEVVFKNAVAEALPFPDAQFDVVMTTVMLHHLPRNARQQRAAEMRRVLKPGGRVLAVDFGGPTGQEMPSRALSPRWSCQPPRHHRRAQRSGLEHGRERRGGNRRLAVCSCGDAKPRLMGGQSTQTEKDMK